METELTIGQVARRAGIATSAIRFYERNGLLPVADRVGGQRRYDEDAVCRLRLIATAKEAGFSLDEIRILLTGADAGVPAHQELRALAARKLPEVDAVIARAQEMRAWLRHAQGCRCRTLEACPLFAPGG